MTGWIKLPRQLITKGYFQMPELAFKIWVYCLLKASPFPNGELKVGQLELSYKEIQQQSPPDKTISKSTIANSLRYLEENGYLKIEAIPFKQLKVQVTNQHCYRLNNGEAAGTATVPDGYADSTSTSTATVPSEYAQSTRTSTVTVPVDHCEPNNIKTSHQHKNKVKNNKELVKNITPENIQIQFPRYSNMQCAAIKDYWLTVLNTTNTTNVAAVGKTISNHMRQWEQFNPNVVTDALAIHQERHRDKMANYTLGIMRRLQKQWENGVVGKGGDANGCTGKSAQPFENSNPAKESRYSHLVRR